MENKDFKIGMKTVWFLVLRSLIITILGAMTKIYHLEFSQPLLMLGVGLGFASWIIILSDMINNKIYSKPFWILSMFIIPSIASFFYLIQRNKLVRAWAQDQLS